MSKSLTRWIKGSWMVGLVLIALGILSACSINPAAVANSVDTPNQSQHQASKASPGVAVTFKMVPSPGIASCLPHATAKVTVTPGTLNDIMKVSVSGLAHSTGYSLFVLEIPNKPFGIAWYQ